MNVSNDDTFDSTNPAGRQATAETMDTSSGPLDGRVALVTGGSRGIGRAVALLLAANGYITGQTINFNGGWYMS